MPSRRRSRQLRSPREEMAERRRSRPPTRATAAAAGSGRADGGAGWIRTPRAVSTRRSSLGSQRRGDAPRRTSPPPWGSLASSSSASSCSASGFAAAAVLGVWVLLPVNFLDHQLWEIDFTSLPNKSIDPGLLVVDSQGDPGEIFAPSCVCRARRSTRLSCKISYATEPIAQNLKSTVLVFDFLNLKSTVLVGMFFSSDCHDAGSGAHCRDAAAQARPHIAVRFRSSGARREQIDNIIDAVVAARKLNATLVIPKLDEESFWKDASDFAEIFDVDSFISSLSNDVKIVRQVPDRNGKPPSPYRMRIPKCKSICIPFFIQINAGSAAPHSASAAAFSV